MKTQHKNIIFIFTDQWRGDCLGCAGHPDVLTPNLDALAQDGMLFNRAYAQAPSCIPARACVVTGKSPNSSGFIGYQDCVIWDYPHTMMTELRDGGYQTINIGKTHFFPQHAHLGFEINRVYDPGKLQTDFESDYHLWLKKESNDRVKDTACMYDGNSSLDYIWQGPEYMHPTSWTTDTAIEYLETRDFTRPFFMQVSYHRPHPPFDPPQRFYDYYRDKKLSDIPYGDWCDEFSVPTRALNAWMGKKDEGYLDRMRKAYYGSITHVDDAIGRLITYLKQHRLYNDTLIVFTSDHGELLGDHYMYRKVSPFEGSARIPFIVKPAASSLHGERCMTPVSHFDLMPTFLSFAGLSVPEDVEGKNILPLLEGKDIGRTRIHGEHCGYGNNGWQFFAEERYKYIWNTMTGREYLFDLEEDPQELKNLAEKKKYGDKIEEYRRALVEILEKRPEDHLVENGRLKAGRVLPAVKEDFLKNSDRLKKELGMKP